MAKPSGFAGRARGCGIASIPQRRDRVALDRSVAGDQGQALVARLGDQQAIERVPVERRQVADAEAMDDGDRQGIEPRLSDDVDEPIERQRELAEVRP